MKEDTQKPLSLVSGGNQKQCSMTESSQQVYPVPIYFCLTLPPLKKRLYRDCFLIWQGMQKGAVHGLFSKLFIILQAIGPRPYSKDNIGHTDYESHFFKSLYFETLRG